MTDHDFCSKSLSLRILVCLVIYDPGKVSLEHLLLSWYPSQSQPTLSLIMSCRDPGDSVDDAMMNNHTKDQRHPYPSLKGVGILSP